MAAPSARRAMSIAASRPSATAVTVRSSPPAAQSPPAQTPGRPVRPGPVTAILPPSTASSPGSVAEPLADRGQHLVGSQREGLGRRARRRCRRTRPRPPRRCRRSATGAAPQRMRTPARPRAPARSRWRSSAPARGDRRSSPPRRRASWPARRRRSRSCRRRSPRPGGRPAARRGPRAWRSSAMKSTAGRTPVPCSPPSASSARTPPRPIPRNTASKSARSSSSVTSRPSRTPVRSSMPPMPSSQSSSAWAKPSDRLVGGDAELVEPAALRPGVDQHHLVPEHRQPVRAGEPGRAGADHRDPPAGRRGARGTDARPSPSARRWRSAAAGRSRPAAPRPPRARRPPRRASRSGRPARTCRRGCSAPRMVRAAASVAPVAISRMNSGMSIEVGQAVTQGASWQK